LAYWPRWVDAINGCIEQVVAAGVRYLNLRGVILPNGLKLPTSIGGGLYLSCATLPDGTLLKLPESIGGGLDLHGAALPDGLLKLPESIGGNLDLRGATLSAGTKLPAYVGGEVYLYRATLHDGSRAVVRDGVICGVNDE